MLALKKRKSITLNSNAVAWIPPKRQRNIVSLYQWFHSSPCQGGGDEELHRILPSVAFHKKNAQVSNMVMDRCSHDLTCPHEQKCILNLWGDQHVKRQSQLCGEIGKFGTAFFQGRHGSAGGIKVSWDPFFFTFKGSRHDWRIIGAASWMLRMMPILRCWRIFDVTCQLRKGNDMRHGSWWTKFWMVEVEVLLNPMHSGMLLPISWYQHYFQSRKRLEGKRCIPTIPGSTASEQGQPLNCTFHCCSVWQLEKAAAALTASTRKPFLCASPKSSNPQLQAWPHHFPLSF